MFLQIILVLVVLIPLVAVVLESQVGHALASRLEQRGSGLSSDQTLKRIVDLEGETDRLTNEVSRLKEESQFLHRLLAERLSAGGDGAFPSSEANS